MLAELITGAAVGTGVTLWACRHTLTTAARRHKFAARALAAATRAGDATEQVAAGAAADLAEVRWRRRDQDRVHLEQVDYYQRLLAWHGHLHAVEARLLPAPVDEELHRQFDAVTAGGVFDDLPVLQAVVDELAEPEPHFPGTLPAELVAVLDQVEETGSVPYEVLVDALTIATGEQPIVEVDPDGGPAEEPQGPAPTAPEPVEVTGGTRDWMGPAARRAMRPVPDPVVIGRSVRALMDRIEDERITALARAVEVAELELVGAGGTR